MYAFMYFTFFAVVTKGRLNLINFSRDCTTKNSTAILDSNSTTKKSAVAKVENT